MSTQSLTLAPAPRSEAAEQVRAEVRDFLAAELAAGTFTTHVDTWLSGVDPAFSRKLGERGWLAIDPKHIFGERTFDYVNMLRNPDPNALPVPERFCRHAGIIAQAGSLDPRRLMQWTYAFAGLSAAWIADDGDHPAVDLAIMELSGAELGLCTKTPARRPAQQFGGGSRQTDIAVFRFASTLSRKPVVDSHFWSGPMRRARSFVM